MTKQPGTWTVSVSRELDHGWRVEDFAADVARLRDSLQRHGHEVSPTSSLARAEQAIAELSAWASGGAVQDTSRDYRPAWRGAISLADLARKILAVEKHPDFAQLAVLLPLLLSEREISLFTATPKEDGENNKLFELLIGASLMRFMHECEVEDPRSKKPSRNPDFIGRWRGRRWGFACKALHSDSPKTTIDRLLEGAKQIKRSDVDAGLVVLNGKNIIPHEEVWPAGQVGGEWHYRAQHDAGAVEQKLFKDVQHQALGGSC